MQNIGLIIDLSLVQINHLSYLEVLQKCKGLWLQVGFIINVQK